MVELTVWLEGLWVAVLDCCVLVEWYAPDRIRLKLKSRESEVGDGTNLVTKTIGEKVAEDLGSCVRLRKT